MTIPSKSEVVIGIVEVVIGKAEVIGIVKITGF